MKTLTDILDAIRLGLGVFGVGLVLLLVWRLVRYIRADQHTRASIRRAFWIRHGWKRLARRLDLAPADKFKMGRESPTTIQTKEVPRLCPPLRTKVDQFSVTATITTVPGVNATKIEAKSEDLQNAWKVPRIKITTTPGLVTCRAFLREPLEAVYLSPLIRQLPEGWEAAVKWRSLKPTDPILWGISEDGDEIISNLANGSHGILSGRTRSGKSIEANTLLATGSMTRHVRLVVIDPNLAAAAPWWRTAYRVTDSTDPDDATKILDEITAELEERKALFWKLRTDKISKFSDEVPLYLVVIDELAGYASHPDKRKAERFVASLLRFASQSAKYGGRLWIITQQPGSSTFPTAVRMNLPDRITFQLDTPDDMKMMFPDAKQLPVTAADRAMPQGVGIAAVGLMTTAERFRAPYLSTEACWVLSDAICEAGGRVRELPGEDVRKLSIVKAAEEEGPAPELVTAGAKSRDRWRRKAS